MRFRLSAGRTTWVQGDLWYCLRQGQYQDEIYLVHLVLMLLATLYARDNLTSHSRQK